MAKIRTHYDNLGVARNADVAVIKAAYKVLVQKYHPDRNPNNPDAERIMQLINKAYEVLSDPIKRAEHDRWIDEQEKHIYSEKNNQQHGQSMYEKQEKSSSHSQNTSSQTSNKKSSIIGNAIIPTIIILFILKIFSSSGVYIGFLGFIIFWIGYAICYHFTYVKMGGNRFVKETVAIFAGLLGLGFTIAIAVSIFESNNKSTRSTSVSQQETTQPVYTQVENNNQVITQNNHAETKNHPELSVAKKSYDESVNKINIIWNSLHPSTQEFLRAEQRSINKKRETDCIAYGNAQSANKDIAKAYRYLCEVPQLDERAEYLKTQLNTIVTAPMQPQQLPQTGATNKPNLVGNSPLKIKTNVGSHYWVKIVSAYNKEVVSYFIRGGETLDVKLPIGSYVVKYAYGDTWYGREHLFGENTRYSQADEVLDFYYGQGYVIELIQQLDGNLHTTAIDASQF